MASKIRADQLLVQLGLAESRTRAQALILAGNVFAGDRRVAKAGDMLAEEAPLVVQPNPFADGQTVVIPRTDAEIQEDPGTGLALVDDSVSLPQVVAGLNALGVSARDMIDILKSIKAAGALHAEFIVQ